jgi:phytanoyl-CoA hydroxylase
MLFHNIRSPLIEDLEYIMKDFISKVERKLKSKITAILKPEPSYLHWRKEKNVLPWFDRPDALECIEKRKRIERLSDEDYLILKKWVEDGYVVIKSGCVPGHDIDQMIDTLDSLWESPVPIEYLTLLDVRPEPNGFLVNMKHAEVLALPLQQRLQMKTASNWRIHGFCDLDASAKNIYANRELKRITSLIFDKPSISGASINFMYGSGQTIHQDMGVFAIHPHNYLIGAWIACEDISPDSGPMFYYPKSHRVPFWDGFSDYPQTNLRTLPREIGSKYHQHLEELSKNFEYKEFIGKKGEVLLWHGMLMHGGSVIKKPMLSRKSYVIHYFVEGVNRTNEVVGPFNW